MVVFRKDSDLHVENVIKNIAKSIALKKSDMSVGS